MNAEVALKELQDYNKAVQTDVPFNPNVKDGRGTKGLAIPKSNWANTLDTAPVEAYAVTCGITFTFGGLRITTDAQVMSTDGLPIPGLYAAGELVDELRLGGRAGGHVREDSSADAPLRSSRSNCPVNPGA